MEASDLNIPICRFRKLNQEVVGMSESHRTPQAIVPRRMLASGEHRHYCHGSKDFAREGPEISPVAR
jgi:hypothetical protein